MGATDVVGVDVANISSIRARECFFTERRATNNTEGFTDGKDVF